MAGCSLVIVSSSRSMSQGMKRDAHLVPGLWQILRWTTCCICMTGASTALPTVPMATQPLAAQAQGLKHHPLCPVSLQSVRSSPQIARLVLLTHFATEDRLAMKLAPSTRSIACLECSALVLLLTTQGHHLCRARVREKVRTPALRLGVPLGTVVKRKRGGALVGELIQPGQTLVAAVGGRGGLGVVSPTRSQPQRQRQACRPAVWSSLRGRLAALNFLLADGRHSAVASTATDFW